MILQECFDPIVAASGRDLIPVMVYGWAIRLFQVVDGYWFATLLLSAYAFSGHFLFFMNCFCNDSSLVGFFTYDVRWKKWSSWKLGLLCALSRHSQSHTHCHQDFVLIHWCYFSLLTSIGLWINNVFWMFCRRNISGQEFGGMYCVVLMVKYVTDFITISLFERFSIFLFSLIEHLCICDIKMYYPIVQVRCCICWTTEDFWTSCCWTSDGCYK